MAMSSIASVAPAATGFAVSASLIVFSTGHIAVDDVCDFFKIMVE
jgi:hypothetical protein